MADGFGFSGMTREQLQTRFDELSGMTDQQIKALGQLGRARREDELAELTPLLEGLDPDELDETDQELADEALQEAHQADALARALAERQARQQGNFDVAETVSRVRGRGAGSQALAAGGSLGGIQAGGTGLLLG